MYYCLLSGSIVHSYVRIIRVLITRKQCQCSSHSYPWRAFAFLPRPGLPPTSITTITPMCTPSHNPRFDSTWPKSYMHHSHHLPYCASLHPSNRLLSYPDISPPAVDPLPFYLVSFPDDASSHYKHVGRVTTTSGGFFYSGRARRAFHRGPWARCHPRSL